MGLFGHHTAMSGLLVRDRVRDRVRGRVEGLRGTGRAVEPGHVG